jgi:hypothetical protein
VDDARGDHAVQLVVGARKPPWNDAVVAAEEPRALGYAGAPRSARTQGVGSPGAGGAGERAKDTYRA